MGVGTALETGCELNGVGGGFVPGTIGELWHGTSPNRKNQYVGGGVRTVALSKVTRKNKNQGFHVTRPEKHAQSQLILASLFCTCCNEGEGVEELERGGVNCNAFRGSSRNACRTPTSTSLLPARNAITT
eukprot:1703617-Pyramimonas_sp.AAC.1